MSAAVYAQIERIAGDEGALRDRLTALGSYEAGQLTAALVTTPMREQLREAGITRVRASRGMTHLHALLIPAREKGKRIVVLCRERSVDEWPLLLAHEMGHARCPGTIGMYPWMGIVTAEEMVECFAQLWLCLPGNRERAKRFLSPLRAGAKEIRP